MTSARQLHPAENRALRELYATTRNIVDHWGALAPRLAGTAAAEPLESGAERARALLEELAEQTARYDLHGFPAAQGVGATLAGSRARLGDLFLERNQAMRTAVLDVQHVTTLLAYLTELARIRGDTPLAAFHRDWELELRTVEEAVRAAAAALGSDPDSAIRPVDDSALGRAAHGTAYAVGSVGEWLDRRASEARQATGDADDAASS
jgi:hypothetical protein